LIQGEASLLDQLCASVLVGIGQEPLSDGPHEAAVDPANAIIWGDKGLQHRIVQFQILQHGRIDGQGAGDGWIEPLPVECLQHAADNGIIVGKTILRHIIEKTEEQPGVFGWGAVFDMCAELSDYFMTSNCCQLEPEPATSS